MYTENVNKKSMHVKYIYCIRYWLPCTRSGCVKMWSTQEIDMFIFLNISYVNNNGLILVHTRTTERNTDRHSDSPRCLSIHNCICLLVYIELMTNVYITNASLVSISNKLLVREYVCHMCGQNVLFSLNIISCDTRI